ncbi:hypothetical protein Ahy_B05g079667 [Arachis hypogaea]|uniref:Uncharacterized protein n=1 Tax=Arachis hypogaea TaxID=3818 RepID=A0A444ZAL1_ARAHY|nr:hypothetical protein Ahy_B05g079667 [Arachis hypogaea]
MLEDVRENRNYLIIWLRPDIKQLLYVHWETDKGFKYRRLTNRANRASVKSSKYTGGSTTFMKTKARLIIIEAFTNRLSSCGSLRREAEAGAAFVDGVTRGAVRRSDARLWQRY